MPEPPTNDALFPELTHRVLGGRCIAFLGAGLSMPMYSDWDGLIGKLCDRCGVTERTGPQGSALTPMALAALALAANRSEYYNTLRREFSRRDPSDRHHLLVRIPFEFYFTTNFDYLLLRAFELHAIPVKYLSYPDISRDPMQRLDVVHLHGRIDPDSAADPSLVLTTDEYAQAYDANDSLLRAFLLQMLPVRSVCFLGCSLTDPYLTGVFRICNALRTRIHADRHPLAPKWFVLLDDAAVLPAKFDDTGVQVVRYDRRNESYQGLNDILEHWAKSPRALPRELRGDEPSYRADLEVPR
jgi:hypothetical protein